jgi:amino acid permease
MDASARSPSLRHRSPGALLSLSSSGPRASWFESYSTTCKCIIGSGVLSLPYAFSSAGWLVGSVGLLVFAAFSYLTMARIIACVHLTRARLRRHKVRGGCAVKYGSSNGHSGHYGSNGFSPHLHQHPFTHIPCSPSPSLEVAARESGLEADPDVDTVGFTTVAGVCYGVLGRRVVDAVLIFAQMGCGTAFLSLVLTSVQAVLDSYGFHFDLGIVACGVFPLVLLLALPRSTTYLAPAAHVGNATLLICVATLIYYGSTQPASHFAWAKETITSLPAYTGSLHGVLLFIGISAFSFAAHAEIVAVEADAASPRAYAVVLPLSILTVAAVYGLVGLFVYACFREETHPNALLNLGEQLYVNIVRGAMALTLIVNYPLAVLPAAQALDLILLGAAPVSLTPHQHEESDARVRAVRIAARTRREQQQRGASSEEQPLISAPRPQPSSASFGNPFASPDLEANGAREVPSNASIGSGGSVNSSRWPQGSPQAVLLGAGNSSGDSGLPPRAPVAASLSSSSGAAAAAGLSSEFGELSPSTPLSLEELEERQRRLFWYTSKGHVIRVLMCILTFSIAASVRNLGVLLSVVGSVAGGFLCFTLPPLLWYKLCQLEGRVLGLCARVSLLLQIVAGIGLIVAGLTVIILQPQDHSTTTTTADPLQEQMAATAGSF